MSLGWLLVAGVIASAVMATIHELMARDGYWYMFPESGWTIVWMILGGLFLLFVLIFGSLGLIGVRSGYTTLTVEKRSDTRQLIYATDGRVFDATGGMAYFRYFRSPIAEAVPGATISCRVWDARGFDDRPDLYDCEVKP